MNLTKKSLAQLHSSASDALVSSSGIAAERQNLNGARPRACEPENHATPNAG